MSIMDISALELSIYLIVAGIFYYFLGLFAAFCFWMGLVFYYNSKDEKSKTRINKT